MNKAIGGYFGFELPPVNDTNPHLGKYAVNTGRSALYCILRSLNPSRIYVPGLLCNVLLEPIRNLGIPVSFYSLDRLLLPHSIQPGPGEYILYINYFGIRDAAVLKLAHMFPNNLIVDNTQAFFAEALQGVPTFYSARKFYGVPDGAYFSGVDFDADCLPRDNSFNRCTHLLKRLDLSPEEGYDDFKTIDGNFSLVPAAGISTLSERCLNSLDHNRSKLARVCNYEYFHQKLSKLNRLRDVLPSSAAAISYPLWVNSAASARKQLIKRRVYVPVFWPTARDYCEQASREIDMIDNILHLPIDQRCSLEDAAFVVSILRESGFA